ncbi:MAG: NAD(P)/FAD-dependent oxidoreductase, partial [Lachnospiraceae bacterium]|nr:NAD(P)/FAD-dependent oxidoreductase [Lachnospiraceae bacterium]
YTAENVIIATGAVPSRPPIKGLELDGVLTSDEILRGCDHVYKSLVIIGGGVIGVELATFYSEIGTEVTIVEGLDRLLPGMDRELGQSLLAVLKKKGVKVYTRAMVESIEKSGDSLCVSFREGGAGQSPAAAPESGQEAGLTSVSGEAVLCAIGRTPFTEGLFADGIEVVMDGRRIAVDQNYETGLEGVYAIGDVSSKIQLAHAATAQGEACAAHIAEKMRSGKSAGEEENPAGSVGSASAGAGPGPIPGCVYCRPEIMTVGLTEAEAKERGIEVSTAKSVMGANSRTLIAGAERSFMKLVADAETGVILGAQFMCTNSTDMAGELTTAIRAGMTAADLLAAVRPHPTFEEALSQALEKLVCVCERA